MKKLVSTLFIAISLSACSINDYQVKCEQQYDDFSDMVSCLNNAVKSSFSVDESPEVSLYLLQADELAVRVKEGDISELQAKIILKQNLINLNNYMEMKEWRKSRRSCSDPKNSCDSTGNKPPRPMPRVE